MPYNFKIPLDVIEEIIEFDKNSNFDIIGKGFKYRDQLYYMVRYMGSNKLLVMNEDRKGVPRSEAMITGANILIFDDLMSRLFLAEEVNWGESDDLRQLIELLERLKADIQLLSTETKKYLEVMLQVGKKSLEYQLKIDQAIIEGQKAIEPLQTKEFICEEDNLLLIESVLPVLSYTNHMAKEHTDTIEERSLFINSLKQDIPVWNMSKRAVYRKIKKINDRMRNIIDESDLENREEDEKMTLILKNKKIEAYPFIQEDLEKNLINPESNFHERSNR